MVPGSRKYKITLIYLIISAIMVVAYGLDPKVFVESATVVIGGYFVGNVGEHMTQMKKNKGGDS